MVPVQVPIIDYQNPFYCPDTSQFHSVKVSDSDNDLSISPFSRKSAATSAYSHEGVKNRNLDTGTSSPSIHAFVYGRNRVTDDHPEELIGRKLTSISYDSSPCARFTSSLYKGGPARKRARYANSARGLNPFGIPDGDWKEPCGIKQEHSSPVLLAYPDQGEQIRQVSEEGYGEIPGNLIDFKPCLLVHPFTADTQVLAPARECSIDDRVTALTLLLRLEGVFPRVRHSWSDINAEGRHQAFVDLLGERGIVLDISTLQANLIPLQVL